MLDVGAVEDFPIGRFRLVTAGGREIGVVRLGDGTFHAMRNVCPHAGAPLCRGAVDGRMLPSAPGELRFAPDSLVVRCPWHSWEFDLRTGSALIEHRRERVRVYDVHAEDGRVLVDLGRRSAA